ncbi:hypothetical protein BamMEX5DRAFT_3178 [Burkholderia ambifaria MEX-5]|uniref:Uncharacterized protein n=1 Tax=Burkholderia ambifaria MEX-5 TaxID=396597 RepID=B1T5W2_9BURK|nr:hypothetical protein BamMEX5DRAFT_3178 [Burkholderia ambifaria MEX-5]
MISHPLPFLLIGLDLALVAMFATGFYWLATKDLADTPSSARRSPVGAQHHRHARLRCR